MLYCPAKDTEFTTKLTPNIDPNNHELKYK